MYDKSVFPYQPTAGMFKRVSLSLFLLLAPVLGGCGDGTVQSAGTVTFSTGEPVPHGTVFFETPQFSYTGQIRNGVYQIEGVKPGSGLPAGTYSVYVFGTDSVTEQPLFDEKYMNPAASGLVFEVKSGQKNVFDFTVDRAKAK